MTAKIIGYLSLCFCLTALPAQARHLNYWELDLKAALDAGGAIGSVSVFVTSLILRSTARHADCDPHSHDCHNTLNQVRSEASAITALSVLNFFSETAALTLAVGAILTHFLAGQEASVRASRFSNASLALYLISFVPSCASLIWGEINWLLSTLVFSTNVGDVPGNVKAALAVNWLVSFAPPIPAAATLALLAYRLIAFGRARADHAPASP